MTIVEMAKPGGIVVYWDTVNHVFVPGPRSSEDQGETPGEGLSAFYGTDLALATTPVSRDGLDNFFWDYLDPLGKFHHTMPMTPDLLNAILLPIESVINPLDLGGGDDGQTPELNWWTPWLKGEALVAGALIAGPTIIDLLAAFADGGKKEKDRNPKLAAGLRHAAESMRGSAEKAMPAIASLLMNPAIALPFVYVNLEALHKQGLIDSAIAHTIEPVMISAVMIESIGKAVGPLAGALLKA